MTRFTMLSLFIASLALPAKADKHLSESAAMGAAAFRQCQACHVVVDTDGNTIAGRKARTGPNLYGIIGRTAGSLEGFRYGRSIVSAGKAGLVWDEENLVRYLVDPNTFLQTFLDDRGARSKMTYKVRPDRRNDLGAGDVARNFYRFLREVGPAMDADAIPEDTGTGESAGGQKQNHGS